MSEEIVKSERLPPSVPAGAGGALRESAGEIYLPTQADVAPDTPEFRRELGDCLPPAVAETVWAAREAARRPYRRIEIIGILLLLACFAWGVYRYFPEPLRPLPFKFEWRYAGPSFPARSPDFGLYKTVRADFERDRYEAVVRELERGGAVDRILALEDFGGADELLFVYFAGCGSTLCRFTQTPTETERRYARAETAVKRDPDNLQWHYFMVNLRRRQFGDYHRFTPPVDPAERARQAVEVETALADLRRLREKLNELHRSPGNGSEIRKQLELIECELLVFDWMLRGYIEANDFYDNENDPGVAGREQAWEIACRYDGDPQARQFLEVRKFIVDTLLAQDSWYNRIFWNGRTHSSQQALRGMQQELSDRLRRRGEAMP